MNEPQPNSVNAATQSAAGPSDSSAATSAASRRASLVMFLAVVVLLAAGVAAAFFWLRSQQSFAEIQRLVDRQAWPHAERELDRYLTSAPDDARARLLQGRVFAAQRRFADCAATLELVPASSFQRGEALLRAGQAWSEAKRRRKSERAWRECLDMPDADFDLPRIKQECRRQLCSMFALERRRDELRAMTEQFFVHALPQGRYEALEMSARYEFVMVEPQYALGLLEPVLELDPDDFVTRRAVGLYQLEAGNTEKARAQLYRCVQERRDDVLAWETWLLCLYQTADLFGLEQALRELPAAADQSAACWKFRAIVADRNENLDELVRLASRALELEPHVPEHQHRLAQALLRQGKRAEAQAYLAKNAELQTGVKDLRAAYERFRQAYPRASSDDRVDLAVTMADAYETLGRTADALAWHAVALSENPAHAPSIDARERLLNEAQTTD